MTSRGNVIMQNKYRGFTIIELLVAIAITAVIMTLLIYPILSANSYIKKAQAQTEAQEIGDQVMQRLKKDLLAASYIFPIPPDGSMVTLLLDQNNAADPRESVDSSGHVNIVRYSQTLAFPWIAATPSDAGTSWIALRPDYQKQNEAYFFPQNEPRDYFSNFYRPFWHRGVPTGQGNPYLLVAYRPSGAVSLAEAKAISIDGANPTRFWTDKSRPDYAPMPEELLRRKLQTQLASVTPVTARWDVVRFQASPFRSSTETLPYVVSARNFRDTTQVHAQYVMIAGRNADVDHLSPERFSVLYPNGTGNIDWVAQLSTDYPLYPLGSNPFGYELRITDTDGNLVYGANRYDGDVGRYTQEICERHFMDWPPIDRADWDSQHPLWNKGDVERQRLEGVFVFAQPMDYSFGIAYQTGETLALPIPTVTAPGTTGWSADLTYLVSVPVTIKLRDKSKLGEAESADNTKVFHQVACPRDESGAPILADLHLDQFCLLNQGVKNGSSRLLAFGAAFTANWVPVNMQGVETPLRYTICDLQAKDIVTGSYSTNGVLDISLTLGRRDTTGRTPAQQRQDFVTTMRVVLQNAIKQMKGKR